ncbi:MAG: hypothetical protein KH434_02365 [Clostridium sp.]|mgnify:FL=1|nr:hypothetical protein [Clostridium sp.]
MKKLKITAYIVLITIVVVIGTTIFVKANEDGQKSQREKALTELKYLDSKIEDIFNEMNNITMRNYKVYTSNIEPNKKESSNTSSESSSSSDSGNSKSSTQTTSNEQEEGNQSNEDEKNLKNYTMQQEGVLTNTNAIDWNKVKNEIELIYTSIPTITLDLYGLNINQDEILNFNRQYDNLTVLVKNQNKEETLRELAKTYQYIPKFAERVTDDTVYKTVLNTKSNIFLAYSKLDSKNWDEISSDIKNAINVFSQLLTGNVVNTNNQTTINKVYVMLNELQNATNVKDEAVFFIKYKNLLEEINNM